METVELEEEVSTPQQDSFEGDSAMEVTRRRDCVRIHAAYCFVVVVLCRNSVRSVSLASARSCVTLRRGTRL